MISIHFIFMFRGSSARARARERETARAGERGGPGAPEIVRCDGLKSPLCRSYQERGSLCVLDPPSRFTSPQYVNRLLATHPIFHRVPPHPPPPGRRQQRPWTLIRVDPGESEGDKPRSPRQLCTVTFCARPAAMRAPNQQSSQTAAGSPRYDTSHPPLCRRSHQTSQVGGSNQAGYAATSAK